MKRYTIDEIYAEKNKKEKRKKVIRVIVYIMILPLLIYNIIILFQVAISTDRIPSIFGYKSFVIVSGSMMPELQIGDIVIIKDEKDLNINQGDIISFREGNSITTHRVAEIIEGEPVQYKTKGDANNAEDINPVLLENIEGKYVLKIPKLGNVVIFMQNKIGIVLIAILIYIFYVYNKNKEERIILRKEKREIYENTIKENEK